jgi:hypothetical protein
LLTEKAIPEVQKALGMAARTLSERIGGAASARQGFSG